MYLMANTNQHMAIRGPSLKLAVSEEQRAAYT